MPTLDTPPAFCQYSDGKCDQSFAGTTSVTGTFLYPSIPTVLAETIELAVVQLRKWAPGSVWRTWKEFETTGHIIFCSICKSCRFSRLVVADVTTLNFNLMFEVGFALGLGLPVIPIRDTTYNRDQKQFMQLGMLDVVGYVDFQNASGLAEAINGKLDAEPIPAPQFRQDLSAPVYIVKSPLQTEGEVHLLSALKKSALHFKAYDPFESQRLSLQEARKAVGECLSVICHLLDPNRTGATVHNARCALVAGLAVASNRGVLLLQEGQVEQPIDYRQIVKTYDRPSEIPRRIDPLLRQTVYQLQDRSLASRVTPEGLLETLDLGDLAAENETYSFSASTSWM